MSKRNADASPVQRIVSKTKMRHCGACGEKFETAQELSEHLKVCKLANIGKNMMEKWNEQDC